MGCWWIYVALVYNFFSSEIVMYLVYIGLPSPVPRHTIFEELLGVYCIWSSSFLSSPSLFLLLFPYIYPLHSNSFSLLLSSSNLFPFTSLLSLLFSPFLTLYPPLNLYIPLPSAFLPLISPLLSPSSPYSSPYSFLFPFPTLSLLPSP